MWYEVGGGWELMKLNNRITELENEIKGKNTLDSVTEDRNRSL